jgi:hypothetical protein
LGIIVGFEVRWFDGFYVSLEERCMVRVEMKVGDLIRIRTRADDNHLWMVLLAHEDNQSIYIQSLKTGYKMNAGKSHFEVISESR